MLTPVSNSSAATGAEIGDPVEPRLRPVIGAVDGGGAVAGELRHVALVAMRAGDGLADPEASRPALVGGSRAVAALALDQLVDEIAGVHEPAPRRWSRLI
jgi:hypothetical protein